MLKLSLVLFALLLIIGCAFALVPQGDASELAENSLVADIDVSAFAEREKRDVTAAAASPCAPPPKAGTSSPTTAPTTAPTSAPTTRPTSAPTSKPPTTPTTTPAPTPKATSAPTPKATSAPTPKATSAPTPKPTSAATPTPKATSRPTTAPTTRPTTTPAPTGSSSVGLCDLVPTTQEPLKLLVPLYVYPGSDWDTVTAAASKVDIVAIINPNSGPDASGPDSSYTSYMNKLKTAGAQMVGYVYTSYGARSIADVKADIDVYASKYPGITGIFFDEGSDSASDLPFYTQAYNYVISKGMVHSIINPGVQPDQGYLAISTSLVVFENTGASASKSTYASWVKCAANASQKSGYKYKFSGIAHTSASSTAAGIVSTFANQGMGMVYVTDGAGGCCTYNTLTSYFASEATSVAAINA